MSNLIIMLDLNQCSPHSWYHHVSQRGDKEGLCICVNWWYESDFAFSDRWALEAFVKEIGQAVRGVKCS